jgi:hypothetical protein
VRILVRTVRLTAIRLIEMMRAKRQIVKRAHAAMTLPWHGNWCRAGGIEPPHHDFQVSARAFSVVLDNQNGHSCGGARISIHVHCSPLLLEKI